MNDTNDAALLLTHILSLPHHIHANIHSSNTLKHCPLFICLLCLPLRSLLHLLSEEGRASSLPQRSFGLGLWYSNHGCVSIVTMLFK